MKSETTRGYSDLDRFFGPVPTTISHPENLIRLELLNKSLPETVLSYQPSIQVRLSELEHLYPWLLNRYGVAHEPKRDYAFDESQQATTVGIKLHHLDSLFDSLYAQMTNQQPVREIFPTLNESEEYIKTIQHIVDHTMTYMTDYSEEDIRAGLTHAWKMIHKNISSDAAGSLPMFNDLDMNNPEAIQAYWNNPEIFQHGLPLIGAWTHAIHTQDGHHMMMNPEAKRYREVSMVLNLQCGIQLQVRFDAVYVLRKGNDVFVSGVDLKSAKELPSDPLGQEIFYRQGQLMKYVLEVFRRQFLLEHDLEPMGKAYNMFSSHKSYSTYNMSPTRLFFRRFGIKEIPEWFLFEELRLEKNERPEFIGWLDWFARALHTTEDTRPFLKRHRTMQKQGRGKKPRLGGNQRPKKKYNNPEAYDAMLL